ncbi:hypothetical protein, partial [Paracoccus marinaquae]
MTTIWPGDLTSIYIGGAMLKALWDSDGDDRAVTDADAWIVQEYFGECQELCVSDPAHAVSDTQAAKRSPNIMANWLRAANHSRTFRP